MNKKLLRRLPKNLFWVVIAATNKSADVLRGTLLPGGYLLENWKSLTTIYDIWPALWNSLKYSAVTTIAELVVSSIAGYGFEVYHDKGKDTLLGILMLTMMIPFTATMIPLYQLYAKLHLLDTTLGFILPSVSAVFLIMSDSSTQTFPMLVSSMTTGHYIDYGMLMLAVLISTLPTIIIFFSLQKSFVEGMTGAIKG